MEQELREKVPCSRISCWGRDGNGEAQKSPWKSVWKRGKSSLQAEVKWEKPFLGPQRCHMAQNLLKSATSEHVNRYFIFFPAGIWAGAKIQGSHGVAGLPEMLVIPTSLAPVSRGTPRRRGVRATDPSVPGRSIPRVRDNPEILLPLKRDKKALCCPQCTDNQ